MFALQCCFMIPEALYMVLLLSSWIAATFTGIAFVYGIHMKKTKRTILTWAGIFVVCVILVFLLMNGFILPDTPIGA